MHRAERDRPGRMRAVEVAVLSGIFLVTAGLVVPVLRSGHIASQREQARADMRAICDAVERLLSDTGVGPTRGRDGEDRRLHRLIGPGRRDITFYYREDEHQGWLEDHLMRNTPARDAPYADWRGPYLEQELTPDPWGGAYVLVIYPMFRHDERDCIVVSAGPNGRMDASYESPRDVIPSGDDLVEVLYDKDAGSPGPLF